MFGRRAALAGLDDPLPAGPPPPAPEQDVAPAPSRETRKAMWVNAGLQRDAEHLRALLDDPHPLARLVAASALAREESRGAHARREVPGTDPAEVLRHRVIAAGAASPSLVKWT